MRPVVDWEQPAAVMLPVLPVVVVRVVVIVAAVRITAGQHSVVAVVWVVPAQAVAGRLLPGLEPGPGPGEGPVVAAAAVAVAPVTDMNHSSSSFSNPTF